MRQSDKLDARPRFDIIYLVGVSWIWLRLGKCKQKMFKIRWIYNSFGRFTIHIHTNPFECSIFSRGQTSIYVSLWSWQDVRNYCNDICDLNTKNDSNISGCQKADKKSTLMLTLSTLFSLQRYSNVNNFTCLIVSTEYTECQAFCSVVDLGPITRKRVSPPPFGSVAHTLACGVRGPISRKEQTH
jgi:hypothetical protein